MPPDGLTIEVPSSIHDKHGHELDGDFDPRGHGGCDHRATPEWKAEHPKPAIEKAEKAEEAEKTEITKPEEPAPMSAPETTTTITVPPSVGEMTATAIPTTATVGVDAAVGQIKALLPAGADASPGLLIGGAAGLAVVGAAVKFGPGLLKARAERAAEARQLEHEERMKKLEIDEKRAESDHGSCSAQRAMLEARVAAAEQKNAALEARLIEVAAKAEKAVSSGPSFNGDFDPEGLEARLKKLEKALKPAGPPAKKKRK